MVCLPPALWPDLLSAVKLEAGQSKHVLEVELSAVKAERVFASIVCPGFDPDKKLSSWQDLDQYIEERELETMGENKYRLSYDGFTQSGEYSVIIQASNQDGNAAPIQTTVTVAPSSKLAGDVNRDSSVNIFDLVMVAGQFGKSGAGLSGDVNNDGSVNIFDLVMVAGNFGKSNVAAAPTMIANKLTFTTQQKWSIQSAIVELEDMPARSDAEELVFNLLKAILPERLPTQTQLLPNYPNPFNPETWIPFQLAQDSSVTAKIYDVTGKLIRMIELGHVPAGNYVESNRAIYWDGRSENGEHVSSGTYFYQIQAGDYTDTRKMVILK